MAFNEPKTYQNADNEPIAVAVEPVPIAVEPVPVAVEPVPVAVEPVPVAVEPVPVAVEPEPVSEPDEELVYAKIEPVPPEPEKIFCIKCGKPMLVPINSGTIKVICPKCDYSFTYSN